ncbi:MAG: ABC transporter substrate-binding protein, partial [Deltaproteobacteria bacterium]
MMKRKEWITGIVILFTGFVLAFGTGFAAEKPIKLGVMFVMSGPMGGYGKHGKQAVQLAVEEINAEGGILGRKTEAIFADDEMKVDKGVQIVKKFISEDKVDFIIGPTSSAVALALADLVEQQKKILVLT